AMSNKNGGRATLPPRIYADKADLSAIDVEVEILVVDFLVFAVVADGLDRRVELLAQRILALADGDSGAFAIDHGIDRQRAENLAAGAVFRLDPFREPPDVVQAGHHGGVS